MHAVDAPVDALLARMPCMRHGRSVPHAGAATLSGTAANTRRAIRERRRQLTASRNALSAEYLYELYSTAIRHEAVCAVLVAHMRREYLPDRTFQHIHEFFVNHYRTYKSPPSYAMLAQTFASDYDALELVNTFR